MGGGKEKVAFQTRKKKSDSLVKRRDNNKGDKKDWKKGEGKRGNW